MSMRQKNFHNLLTTFSDPTSSNLFNIDLHLYNLCFSIIHEARMERGIFLNSEIRKSKSTIKPLSYKTSCFVIPIRNSFRPPLQSIA